MAAAVPFALKVAPMVAGALLGKKTSGASGGPLGQKSAMEGQQQAAQQVGGMAQPLMSQGLSMAQGGGRDLDAASGYYKNILSSRQGARESLAPEMTTAMDFYRGAENKTKRTMQGGSRDYALAELDRQKVGQMAGMLPAARRAAAEGMAGIGGQRIAGGSSLTGQGVNAASNAGYISSNLFGNATTIKNQEQEGGSVWGKFLGDIVQELPWGKGKSPLPSTNFPVPIYKGPGG